MKKRERLSSCLKDALFYTVKFHFNHFLMIKSQLSLLGAPLRSL